jgi:hypothetical protein
LAKYVEDVIEKFEIGKKIFCITTDGASNNKTMMISLAESLNQKYGIEMDSDEQRIPCLAHIINLAVSAFLENLKVAEDEASSSRDDEATRACIASGEVKNFPLTILKIREICNVLSRNKKNALPDLVKTNFFVTFGLCLRPPLIVVEVYLQQHATTRKVRKGLWG